MDARLREVVEAGNYDRIATFLDEAELESVEGEPLLNWPHALHLLSHLHRQSLEDARFLYKRFPEAAKEKPEVQAAWRICKLFWNRSYESYWEALQGYEWSPEVALIVHSLGCSAQEKIMKLVEKAYSNISAEKLARFTGMSHQEALQKAQELGWEIQENTLKIVKKPPPPASRDGLRNLQQLTEYVVRLEA
ncbi:hypothetical protein BSKO_10461 [Bryopsis sp. KO-2023]|nr:hypothetical protein BSKO_10461 [Bryopsis sp. KO-2023]